MAQFLATRAAIGAIFKTEFAAAQPTVQIVEDNVRVDPLNEGEWVRLSFRGTDNRQISVGIKSFREDLLIFAEIYTPLGDGDGRSLAIADSIATIFSARTLPGGIVMAVSRLLTIGMESPWYHQNVITPVKSDETNP